MNVSAAIQQTILAERLARSGFSFPDECLANLSIYLHQLMKWNKAMNLVGTNSWEKTLDTLVLDSFHLADFFCSIDLAADPTTFDLGAGAGLPGIPLRMVWSKGTYTLVEVREKRALFMKTVLASLNLERVRVFQGRAEDFFASETPADRIISRAFMPWQDMLAFIADALAPEGQVVFLTLSPAPEKIPVPWRLVAQKAYWVDKTQRHFWCLTRSVS